MYRCNLIADEYFNLGLQFRNFGNYEEAIRNYDKSIDLNPTFPRSWLEKGEAFASLGRLKDANECFNKATNIGYMDIHNKDIGYTPALFWADKGCSLQWLEKHEEAVECFNKSIKLDKNCIEAYIGKSKSLCYLFRYEEAIDSYRQILEFLTKDEICINRDSLLEDIWTNIGITLNNLGKYDEAIKCFNKVLEWDDQYLDALKGKGKALYLKEDYREAISCLNCAKAISPKDSDLWYDLGRIYLKILDYEEAINCYDRVIMLNFNYEDEYKTSCLLKKAWCGKGYIFISRGEYEKSIKCFNNVIRYDPYNIKILNSLSIAYRNLGDYEKSIEYCDNIINNLEKMNQLKIDLDLFSNYEIAKRNSEFSNPEIYDNDINIIRDFIKKNKIKNKKNSSGFYEALKNKACALLVLGKNEEAVMYLEEAKSVNNNPEILNALGIAYKNLCNYEKAIELFNEALAWNPKYLKALANKAETLDCLGNFSEAINCFNEVLNFEDHQGLRDEKEDQLSEAWSNKGLALIYLRSYSEANIAFDNAIKFWKFNEIAWYGKGKALNRIGHKDDALYCFKKANDYFDKTNETRSSEYLIHKGSTLLNLHRYRESIICYSKAAELENNSSELWYNMGASFLSLHKYDEAIECYEKVIGMNHQQLKDVYINLCYAYMGLGCYERAALCFSQTNIEAQKSISALNAKAILFIEQGKYEEAVKCYDILTNIKPRDHKIWNNRGVALKRLNKFQEAIECFETALELNEEYALALNNKGNIYYELRNFKEAINCYDKAIQMNSDYFDAIFNKAKIFIKLENLTEAIIYLDKAILLANHNSNMAYRKDFIKNLLLTKASILTRLGYSRDSIDCLNKIIVFDPEDLNLNYFLGNLLYKEKEYDQAINCYDNVISKLISFPGIANAEYYIFDISMKLSEIFTNMNLYDYAEECLRNAQKLAPTEIVFNPELIAIESKIQKGKISKGK